jgi:Spy/CpxP family protein refolding chaperone
MAKSIIRIIFIISISLNVALAVHLFKPQAQAGNINNQENPLQLNLSEIQSKEVNKIRMANHRSKESLKKEITKCQQQIVELLKGDKVDKTQINECIQKIASLQVDIQKNTIDEILQMKKILDKTQCNCLMEGLQANMKGETTTCKSDCCNPKIK